MAATAAAEEETKPFTTLDTYRLLGASGLRVSPLCMGCMTFGTEWGAGADKEQSRKLYDVYRSKGGNFFDTANLYTNCTSEKYLGEFLESHRSEVVIATKYSGNPHARNPSGKLFPNAGGNSRKSMVENLDESLKRLGVQTVDVFYLHFWDDSTPTHEIVRGLDDVVRAGKAHYVAVSDAPSWFVSRANTMAELRGLTPFIGLQTRYNLLDRSFEGEYKSLCKALSLGTVAWGALAEGFLTGKHSRESFASDTGRKESVGRHINTDKNWAILEEVKKIAQELGRTPGQVALNWLLAQGITSPLIGARTPEQLEDNLGALDFTLSADHLKRLDEVSKPDLAFPWNGFSARASFFADGAAKVDRTRTYLA